MAGLVQSFHQATAKFSTLDGPLLRFQELVFVNVAYLCGLWAIVRVMKHAPAFELRAFRVFYNASCVALSAYTAYLFISEARNQNYGFVCNNSFPDSVPVSRMQHAAYVFYLSKLWELQDTFIMALRKSFRQITFLHVYHHVSVSVVVWCYCRFTSGGDEWVPASLNSIVHVLMYSHYVATTLGASAPWKPLLTTMQIAQFIIIFAQSVLALRRSCGWADFLNALQLGYMASMIVLFSSFFVHAYMGGQRGPDKHRQD